MTVLLLGQEVKLPDGRHGTVQGVVRVSGRPNMVIVAPMPEAQMRSAAEKAGYLTLAMYPEEQIEVACSNH